MNDLHGAQFHLVIVLVDIGADFHLLDFDDLLFLAGFVALFLLFVFELAVIENFRHRRLGIGADLDEVESHGISTGNGVAGAEHPHHLAILVDEPHLRNSDFFVDPGSFARWRGGWRWRSGYSEVSCYDCGSSLRAKW